MRAFRLAAQDLTAPLRRALSDRVSCLARAQVCVSRALTLALEDLPLCAGPLEYELVRAEVLVALDVAAAAARALHVAGYLLAWQSQRHGATCVPLAFSLLYEPLLRYTRSHLLLEDAFEALVDAWACPGDGERRAALRASEPSVLGLYDALELAEHLLAFHPKQALT